MLEAPHRSSPAGLRGRMTRAPETKEAAGCERTSILTVTEMTFSIKEDETEKSESNERFAGGVY